MSTEGDLKPAQTTGQDLSPTLIMRHPDEHPVLEFYCGAVLLKKAVFCLVILDLILGLWYVIESLLLLAMLKLVPGHFEELLASVVNNLVSVGVGTVAALGLWGIAKEKRSVFVLYYRAKVVELGFSFAFCPSTSHMYCPAMDLGCQAFTLVVMCLTKIGVNAVCVYVLRLALSRWPAKTQNSSTFNAIQLKEVLPADL